MLSHRTNGWRDLSVLVAGGGIIPGYQAVLQFDGRAYPSNPSMQKPLSHLRDQSGEAVIASYDQPNPL